VIAAAPARIRCKREFYRLWRAGLLGNRPRTWADATALAASGWPRPVVARSSNANGWKTRYGIAVEEALALARQVPGLTFNECLPDEALLIQGEVMRGERGLELTYSTVRKPMKVALAEETRSALGLAAKMLLDFYLWPTSRDDLDALLDLYPAAVVEFGAYDRAIGDQPFRNTLFWEVRNY
jgi:hypothetical protein